MKLVDMPDAVSATQRELLQSVVATLAAEYPKMFKVLNDRRRGHSIHCVQWPFRDAVQECRAGMLYKFFQHTYAHSSEGRLGFDPSGIAALSLTTCECGQHSR